MRSVAVFYALQVYLSDLANVADKSYRETMELGQ